MIRILLQLKTIYKYLSGIGQVITENKTDLFKTGALSGRQLKCVFLKSTFISLSASNPQVGSNVGRRGFDGELWCICLGWRTAVAGTAVESQLQVIGSSIYCFCIEAGA